MNIGIDIGGSHIAVGLVDNGNIISLKEKDFLDNEREDIYNILENTIVEYIKDILEENKINIKEIEKVGLAVPRRDKGWNYCQG